MVYNDMEVCDVVGGNSESYTACLQLPPPNPPPHTIESYSNLSEAFFATNYIRALSGFV